MNDRAVSVTVNYTLTLMITTLLMSGLLFAAGHNLETRQQEAIRAELEVIGQRLATGLMTADRLVQAGGDDVSVSVSIPDRVAGTGYDIEVNASASRAYIQLTSEDPVASTNVTFVNRTAVDSLQLDGGDVNVILAADGVLEVESA